MPPQPIRRVKLVDRPDWLRMRRLLWPNTDPANLAAELDSMLKDDEGSVFVTERTGAGLCGLLEAGIRWYEDGCETSPVGYIEGWYVNHDMRGRGIGAALIHEAEDWARERGLKELASDAELTNESSLKAHLALGYHETERLIHFARAL